MLSILLVGLGVLGLTLSAVYSVFSADKNLAKIPAGPPRLPIIGNLHQLPKTGAHRLFTEWAKRYGGIFSLRLGPATIAVISDRRLVKEMIDKKSAIYSARPPSYVSHDLITKGDHLLVMNHDAKWRTFRKLIHQYFMETMVEKEHMSLVEAEETQMMHDFLVHPELHMLHSKRTSNSIVMSLLYGIRTKTSKASHVVELYEIMERWSEVMEVGATPPVDIFPILKIIPEAWFGDWIQKSLDVGRSMKSLYGTMHNRVLTRRKLLGSRGSFIDQVLDQQDKLQLTRNQLDFIGGVMMEGGSDTVSTMMLVVLQALALNPDVQRRAHEQIDSVMGEDRSPSWSDFCKLTYVSQIIKEAIRWRPVTPLAFPHALAKDDWVDGQFLPQGTTVIINVWGLHHDPVVFANPDIYDPARYEGKIKLAAEYASSPDYKNRDHYVYGAGRRICPGIHLAERELFLGTAKLLWGFNIEQKRDENGLLIPIDTNPLTGYSEGFLVCPKTFECQVTVRSKARAETIQREHAKAGRDVFSKYEE